MPRYIYQDSGNNSSFVGLLLVSPVENPQNSVERFLSVRLFEMSQRNVALCLVSSRIVLPSAPTLTFSVCLLS